MALMLLALAAAAGFYVSYVSRQPAVPVAATDAASEEPAPPVEPTEGPAIEAAPEEEDPRPARRTPLSRSSEAAIVAPAVPPSDTGASFEDIVGAASPAVVSVQAGPSRGTGFFVDRDLVLTNVHVVGSQTYVTLKLAGGRTLNARVERTAPDVDIALLRVASPPSAQPRLTLGSTAGLRSGQEVVAIGSALGVLEQTVTRGIISALRRAGPVRLIQTDAAINRGNSGGPLLDRDGRVIGITTLKAAGAAESIGFAIAIDHARSLIEGRPLEHQATQGGQSTGLPLPSSAGGPSEADQMRQQAEGQFGQAIQGLAKRADQLDDYWARFKRSCGGSLAGATGDRDWFDVLQRQPTFTAAHPQCASWLHDVQQIAGGISETMRNASESARRQSVYPGTLRDIRRRHRMDWSGWER